MPKMTTGNIPRHFQQNLPVSLLKKGLRLYEQKKYSFFDFGQNYYYLEFRKKEHTIQAHFEINPQSSGFYALCNCAAFNKKTRMCPHIVVLLALIYSPNELPGNRDITLFQAFQESIWYKTSRAFQEIFGKRSEPISAEIDPESNQLTFTSDSPPENGAVQFTLSAEALQWLLVKYPNKPCPHSQRKALPTFEKKQWEIPFFERSRAYQMASLKACQIFKTSLQDYLDSYWFDIGKIWYFEFNDKTTLRVDYDLTKGLLVLTEPEKRFHLRLPRQYQPEILALLHNRKDVWEKISVVSQPARLDYKVEINDQLALVTRPVLRIQHPDAPEEIVELSESFLSRQNVIGRFMYVPDLGFIPFQHKDFFLDPQYFALHPLVLSNEKIADFIKKYKVHLDNDRFYAISPALVNQKITSTIASRAVFYQSLESGWLYLSVKYQVGSVDLSFYDIYKAFKEKKKYLISRNEWIDLQGEDFEWIFNLDGTNISTYTRGSEAIPVARLSCADYLKFKALFPITARKYADAAVKDKMTLFENFKTAGQPPDLSQYPFQLRDYQNLGYAWLWFLYENRLSGLLCDDMGLGKTFESLAQMAGIIQTSPAAKFLIVCPTSVIHHWRNKLQLIPELHLTVYHGHNRELPATTQPYAAILTSYGTLRNDIDQLKIAKYTLVIFDEIQTAKNKSSLIYAATRQIRAEMLLGLTGTPVENYISELKALFDIILPGYLGSDSQFEERFIKPIEKQNKKSVLKRLHRLVHPFTLRRTKAQVLTELPPKIEEIRTCELSDDQVKLYRDVIETRAGAIVQQLQDENEKIPYMHIFAILNYLKQICNHPSQLEDGNLDYTRYESGKWDLFCELLNESLNSGLKVVVFSQYLNMLALIEKYLSDNHIQFATIKGSTRNREEMIEQFNTDPACQVFTASLLAGGLGIDLVGGSVVIHYDRWWNAAREDQATDRVHRIGQQRGVQVFKLVTEGTLEEKIDRLIFKKKNLLEELVTVDEATLMKQFSREDFLELLNA